MTVSAPGRPRQVTPVGIVADQLAEALRLLDDPDGPAGHADPRVRAAVASAHRIAAGLDGYVAECSGVESDALRALADATAQHDWTRHRGAGGPAPLEQEMVSGHVEGRLLAILVHATRARSVLEIGMFTGYSALAMAEALPPEGLVVACEIDPEAASLARQCFAESSAGGRIEVRLGPALDTLRELAAAGHVFDLVFVDADKAGYGDYLAAVLDGGLLAEGGLVCVDNTLMQGQPWASDRPTPAGAAIDAFNRAVAGDPRLDQVVVPVRDGLTLIRRTADQTSSPPR